MSSNDSARCGSRCGLALLGSSWLVVLLFIYFFECFLLYFMYCNTYIGFFIIINLFVQHEQKDMYVYNTREEEEEEGFM